MTLHVVQFNLVALLGVWYAEPRRRPVTNASVAQTAERLIVADGQEVTGSTPVRGISRAALCGPPSPNSADRPRAQQRSFGHGHQHEGRLD